jgi:hypothetical protein
MPEAGHQSSHSSLRRGLSLIVAAVEKKAQPRLRFFIARFITRVVSRLKPP